MAIGKPLGDRVLIKIKDTEKSSSGGIILSQSSQSTQTAEVVEVSDGFVGPGGEQINLSVSKGDSVLINNGTGQKIRLDGEDYHLVRESEILMKL